jgi:hypothetical protein
MKMVGTDVFVFYSHIMVDQECFMNILYKTCKIVPQWVIRINLIKINDYI